MKSLSIPLIILAGIMNASFIIPTKYTKKLSFERTWFYHSAVGMLIIPWLFFLLQKHCLTTYTQLQTTSFQLISIAGLLFGIGQITFAYSIDIIGVGYAFPINLSIGMVTGAFSVIIYNNLLFSRHCFIVCIASCLLILSLALGYKSNTTQKTKNLKTLGWMLALFTGITSGLQNFTFIYTAQHSPSQSNLFWIWPLFLSFASLPMLIGFFLRSRYLGSEKVESVALKQNIVNIGLIILMGLLFTGSLTLYSLGMNDLTKEMLSFGWPVFIICIVLTSKIWEKHFQKNTNTLYHKIIENLSILLLVIAVAVLSLFK